LVQGLDIHLARVYIKKQLKAAELTVSGSGRALCLARSRLLTSVRSDLVCAHILFFVHTSHHTDNLLVVL